MNPFPAALDELFGVTNSKQAAVHFTRAMELWRMTKSDKETSFLTTLEDLQEAEDMQYQLYQLVQEVMKAINNLSKIIEEQKRVRRRTRPKLTSVPLWLEQVVKDRKQGSRVSAMRTMILILKKG